MGWFVFEMQTYLHDFVCCYKIAYLSSYFPMHDHAYIFAIYINLRFHLLLLSNVRSSFQSCGTALECNIMSLVCIVKLYPSLKMKSQIAMCLYLWNISNVWDTCNLSPTCQIYLILNISLCRFVLFHNHVLRTIQGDHHYIHDERSWS
jgi:hypothetical protein